MTVSAYGDDNGHLIFAQRNVYKSLLSFLHNYLSELYNPSFRRNPSMYKSFLSMMNLQ